MFCIHIQTYCILLIIGLHGLRLFFIYFLFVTVNNFTDLLNLIGWYRISFLSIAKLISISEYNDCINCCIISKKLSLKNNVLDIFFITLGVIFFSFPKRRLFFFFEFGTWMSSKKFLSEDIFPPYVTKPPSCFERVCFNQDYYNLCQKIKCPYKVNSAKTWRKNWLPSI